MSLRLLWFLLLLFVGCVPVLVVNRIVLAAASANEIQSRINRIQNQWLIVANQVSRSGYVDNPQNEAIDAELVQMANLQDGRVIVVNRSFRTVRDTYEIDTGKYNISESVLQCFSGKASVNYYKESGYIDFAQPIYSSDNQQVVGVMLLSASTASAEELKEKLADRMLLLEIIEFVLCSSPPRCFPAGW